MKKMIIDDRDEDENEDKDEDDKFKDERWIEILWMKKPGHLDAPEKWKKPPPV